MIRIKFRHDDGIFETMLLEDRKDIGPEIRKLHDPDCDADRTQTLDVPIDHCPACSDTIAEQLELTPDERERIIRWRDAAKMTPDERIEENMTPSELGAILDKIVARLDTCDEHGDETQRIVVQVEPTP